MEKIKNFIFCLIILSIFSLKVYAADFSCPAGTKGACIGLNENVCVESAKCVSIDAVCFNAQACNYKGYVCKSEVDKLADEYDTLVKKYQEVSAKHDYLVEENNGMIKVYNELVNSYNAVVAQQAELKECVKQAETLEEVKDCNKKGKVFRLK